MAAFGVVRKIEDVQFDNESSKIRLILDALVFDTVGETTSTLLVEVLANFETADWRVKTKDAIKARALSDLGLTVDWVLLGDLSKT